MDKLLKSLPTDDLSDAKCSHCSDFATKVWKYDFGKKGPKKFCFVCVNCYKNLDDIERQNCQSLKKN